MVHSNWYFEFNKESIYEGKGMLSKSNGVAPADSNQESSQHLDILGPGGSGW